uniref:Uncharacterized protein n=1 Tax=Tetranychus urticae TaxID=32264 RepID=T1KP14_TETUR
MVFKFSLIIGLLTLLPSKYAATQDRPKPEIKVDDEKVYIGSDVTLHCKIDSSFSNQFKVSAWFTDDGLIFLAPTLSSISTASTISSDSAAAVMTKWRQIILSNGNLYIYNITRRDLDRKYRCQVQDLLTGARIDSVNWATLSLIGPSKNTSPIIHSERLSNKYIHAEEGDILLINCPIIGFPRPDIRWFKHTVTTGSAGGYTNTEQQLPGSSHLYPESIMFIPRLTFRDSGKYQCSANNSFGQNHFELTLFLKRDIRVAITSNNPEPAIGSDVTFNCSLIITPSYDKNLAQYSDIIREVKWHKNMSQLSNDNRIAIKDAHQMTIHSLNFHDNGIYQCFIKTYQFEEVHHEKWYHSSITLKIPEKAPTFGTVFPEQIKITGTQLSLKCSAFGSPIPTIKWRIDGKHVDNGFARSNVYGYLTADRKGFTSFLNISSLTVQDAGTYECIAENSVSSVSHLSRIDIIGPPGIKPMDNMTAIMGQTYQLYCPYTGYPVDEVYFTKNNRRLPFEERHIHVGLGKINILSVSKEDAGFYKCIVSSLNGERYESNLYLHVVAPPILSPFSFPTSLEEGMRISIMCSVISGDPPITIAWLKNGLPLADRSEPNPSIHIVSLTEYVSSLIIENLNKTDSGNYTCSASSLHSWTSYSAQLTVKSKPHFTLTPSGRIATTEMPVLFNCQADGVPSPVIRWKFQRSATQTSEPVAILSSPRVHVLENGSLHIRTVSLDDEGTYLCEASNGLGKSISVSAFLKVHEPPKIRPVTSKSIVKRSERTELICQASGSLPMVIEWFKDGYPLSQGSDEGNLHTSTSYSSNYNLREEDDAKYKVSILTIHSATRNDSALYICNAINFYGSAKTIVKVIVQEPSDPPDNLRATQIKSNSLTVTWTVHHTGNSPILGFIIEYRTASVPLDSKSVRISWIIRDSLETGEGKPRKGVIEGFYIGYKIASTQGSFTYSTMHLPDPNESVNSGNSVTESLLNVPSYEESTNRIGYNSNFNQAKEMKKYQTVISSLKKSTKYAIIVQAFNKEGEGPYSDQIVVETFANDPPKAPKLSFESSTSGSASLTWSLGYAEADSIHGFILSFRCDKFEKEEVYDDIRLPKIYRRYLLSNLLCGTKYSARMCAFNEVGKGEPSNEIFFKTEGTAPIAPDKNSFITSNITMVTLWLTNWSDGKCPIDYFEVQYKPQYQPEWILHSNRILPNLDRIDIREMLPGTWYDLLVTAKNEAGPTEAKYLVATLDITGATVAPLLYNDSKSLVEGLMILVPSISAIIVLILVALFAIYIVFLRPQRETIQSDLYGTHQGADSVSLHSYNKAIKGEPVYEHQRAYCTSLYSTGNNENLEIRDNPGQLCSMEDEYRFVIDNRIPRKGVYDHIYDVPHRQQKIFTALH